eukprot:jgi/Orpsp1_1/1178392/evm.model.c7180000065098.1
MLEYPKKFIKEIPVENLCKETTEMALSIISVFCQYYSEIDPPISDENIGEILNLLWYIMKYSKDNENYMNSANKSLSNLISQSNESQFEFIFNKFINEVEIISFNIQEQDDNINHITVIINSLAILLKNVSGEANNMTYPMNSLHQKSDIKTFNNPLFPLLSNYGHYLSIHHATNFSRLLSAISQKPTTQGHGSNTTFTSLSSSAANTKPFIKHIVHILGEYVNIQTSNRPLDPLKKNEIITGLNALLDLCDEHDREYVLVNLSHANGGKIIFKKLVEEWKKNWKFGGKV